MLYLKPFDAKVPDEVAQLFLGLQHLDPTECANYLIDEILDAGDDSVVVQQATRLLTQLGSMGYNTQLQPGLGYMIMLELMLGDNPQVMKIALQTIRDRWRVATQTVAISDCLGAMAMIVSYIHFHITERGIEYAKAPILRALSGTDGQSTIDMGRISDNPWDEFNHPIG